MATTENTTSTTTTTTVLEDQGTRPRARDRRAAQPTENLVDDLVELSTSIAAGTYEFLVLVGEYDARGAWELTGALSCASWLADVCDIEVCTARTQVRVARALREFPLLDRALADGTISYAKARVLVAALTVDNEAALIGLATHIPAARLGVAIARWSKRNEDPETIVDRQHQARKVTWRTQPDGSITMFAKLPPLEAGKVIAVLDSVVIADRAPAGASLAQQRADALVHAITNGGGPATTEVVIHVNEDGSALPDGTPLADHAVAGLLPEAFISLLMHDNERHPIDASPRRRMPTRRQRRVLDARSAECEKGGCHARDLLQYDHIQPYAQHGPTVLANLRRHCGPHNRGRNNERW